jgi:hypothetical protein
MLEFMKGWRTKAGVVLGMLVGLGVIAGGVQSGDWTQIQAGLGAIAAALGVAGIRWADWGNK